MPTSTPPIASTPPDSTEGSPSLPIISCWQATMDRARQSFATVSGPSTSTTLAAAPAAPSRYPTTLGIATALAQKEVQSGFRSSSSSSKLRSASRAKPLPLRIASAKGSVKARSTRKVLQAELESSLVQVGSIVVVPWAIDYLVEDSNNSGRLCYSIQGCPSPRPALESHLMSYGYCRTHQPQDKLELDRHLDADETAAWIASVFPSCWKQYCQEFDLSPSSSPPAGWLIHLKKNRFKVSSFAGQVGATMEQLIEEGSMTGGRPSTKKIYIAFPVKLRYADPNPNQAEEFDVETDSGRSKRQKYGLPDSESDSEAGTLPQPHHKKPRSLGPTDAPQGVSTSLSASALGALAAQFPQPSPPSPMPTDIEVNYQVEHASTSFSALLRISDPPSKDIDITEAWLESKDTDNVTGSGDCFNGLNPYGSTPSGSGSNPFQDGYVLDI